MKNIVERILVILIVTTLISSGMLQAESPDNKDGVTSTPEGWSEDVRLTDDVKQDVKPAICVEDNHVSIAWEKDTTGAGGHYDIYYIDSTDGGTNWNSPFQLTSGISGTYCRDPDIGRGNDIIHVVWSDNNATAREIRYRSSPDGGQNWDTEKMISADDGNNSEAPKIAVSEDGMSIHVVWVDSRYGIESTPPNTELYYNRSLDGGVTWEGEQRLTNASYASAPRGIVANGDEIHILWSDGRIGITTGDVYYKRSLDNGATWDDGQGNIDVDRRLTTNSTSHIANSIAVNGSTIHTIWTDTVSDDYFIYYCKSTDNGGNWSTPELLTGPSQMIASPAIAVEGDDVNIVWDDSRDGDIFKPEIYFKNSTDGGISWGSDLRLTYNLTGASQWPRISVTGGMKHVVWWDDRDGNREIYYKRHPDFPVADITPPEIEHEQIGPAVIGQPINITANVTDGVGVDAVFLNYTAVNGTNHNVSMQKWNGNWSYDIPGQDNIGIVEYFIWANDTSGNANMTANYTVQILDETAPEIDHTLESSAYVLDVINVTAIVMDDVAVDKVFLDYTGVNGTNYNVSMNRWGDNFSYDIPGQGNSGFVNYFIWANDTSGNNNRTVTHQVQIIDITEPKIHHVPVTAANVSEIINITANVIDDVSVNSVYLNYTDVDGASHNVSMQKWNGNYSYEIPGQNTIGNVRYFIWANDSDGNGNRTVEYSIQINDVTKPEINHVPVISANVGEPINITVNVTDDVAVDKVFLNYTDVAGDNYNVSMNKYGDNWSYLIAGQNDIGIVGYFIWANDTSGNDNWTQVYQIQIIDVVKPEIEHSPVTAANVSEAINITARITDDVGVGSVYLNYTDVVGINHNVTMTKWNGNWSYVIPGQLSAGNLTYFIWANDTSGNANQTDVYQVIINEVEIPDTTPPIVVSVSPTGVNVPVATTIRITFDEPMNVTSVRNAITLSPGVQAGYSWNADNTVLTITPSGNLSYNTTYSVAVGTEATDAAGNNLVSAYSWEFTTEAEDGITTNGGGPREYWWIVLVIVVVTMVALYLLWKNRRKEEPEEETGEREGGL